jgi:hypothetical protein
MDNEFTGQWIGHGGQMSCPLDLRINLLLNPAVGPQDTVAQVHVSIGMIYSMMSQSKHNSIMQQVCMSINIERGCLNMYHNYI